MIARGKGHAVVHRYHHGREVGRMASRLARANPVTVNDVLDGLTPVEDQLCGPGLSEPVHRGWAGGQLQATHAGIGFTDLSNGFVGCDDPAALQAICDRLGPGTIRLFAE